MTLSRKFRELRETNLEPDTVEPLKHHEQITFCQNSVLCENETFL